MRWHQSALLGYGVVIGLFFAVVSLGAFGFVVTRSLDGTLLSPVERTASAIGTYFVIALILLWFGSFALRWSFGSLVDLFGAELVLYGPVEELKVHRGSRGLHSAVVAGETVELSPEVFATLAKGDRVWMRVGRFQLSLKELARPDRIAPPRAPARSQEGAPAAPAAAPPIATDAAAAARAKAHGPIADTTPFAAPLLYERR